MGVHVCVFAVRYCGCVYAHSHVCVCVSVYVCFEQALPGSLKPIQFKECLFWQDRKLGLEWAQLLFRTWGTLSTDGCWDYQIQASVDSVAVDEKQNVVQVFKYKKAWSVSKSELMEGLVCAAIWGLFFF